MYRGGAQRVMANIANYLNENKWDVILINDFEPDPRIVQYSISDNIVRLYLRKDLLGNPIIKNLDRIRTLRTIIKREKPDVVLSFLGRPNKRMLISTIGLSCKKIVSIRNDPNKEYGSSVIKRIMTNCLFLNADGCVFQTEEAANYFIKAIQKKSVIILNPIDEKFYKIERFKNTRNIITFGRLEPQKNHKYLIHAFAGVADKYPDDKLIIYGEGSLREELLQEIKECNLSERVLLPGDITDVEKYLAAAKAFVLSSDYEGLPNALMEAMAVGIPCISTDCPCGGPRQLIRNRTQGILVECNNVNQMQKALDEVLSYSSVNEMGIEAKKRAEEFKSKTILKAWEAFLQG